jgi:hypothetical protein
MVPRPAFASARVRAVSAVVVTPSVRQRQPAAAPTASNRGCLHENAVEPDGSAVSLLHLAEQAPAEVVGALSQLVRIDKRRGTTLTSARAGEAGEGSLHWRNLGLRNVAASVCFDSEGPTRPPRAASCSGLFSPVCIRSRPLGTCADVPRCPSAPRARKQCLRGRKVGLLMSAFLLGGATKMIGLARISKCVIACRQLKQDGGLEVKFSGK